MLPSSADERGTSPADAIQPSRTSPAAAASSTQQQMASSVPVGGGDATQAWLPPEAHCRARSALWLGLEGLPADADAKQIQKSVAQLGFSVSNVNIDFHPLSGVPSGRGELRLRNIGDTAATLSTLANSHVLREGRAVRVIYEDV